VLSLDITVSAQDWDTLLQSPKYSNRIFPKNKSNFCYENCSDIYTKDSCILVNNIKTEKN